MRTSSWHWHVVIMILVIAVWGCALPPPPQSAPGLTATEAQATLNKWNPSYCKVVEFYGFFNPGGGDTRVAYVLLANPADAQQKPLVYEARFQVLTRADGQPQWFLTSLISHAGVLTRRQGWDNLFIPVKTEAPAADK